MFVYPEFCICFWQHYAQKLTYWFRRIGTQKLVMKKVNKGKHEGLSWHFKLYTCRHKQAFQKREMWGINLVSGIRKILILCSELEWSVV